MRVRIVLVIGAGASLAQAVSMKNMKPDRLPPLDSTFFRRIADLGIDISEQLAEHATELLGHDPFVVADAAAPGMEEFFKDLFYDFVSDREDEDAYAAYRQLVNVYVTALRRTTNPVAAAGARGPLLRLLRAAASSTHLSVVTFNHDLILENVISRTVSLRRRWCLRHGYGDFAEDKTYVPSQRYENFPDPMTCRHREPVLIHKLHGSLNWNVPDDEDDRALMRGEGTDTHEIRVTLRTQIPQRLQFRGRPLRPLVVPPVYAKGPFLEGFLEPVWRQARQDIAAADRVVFFGYSLPIADIEAEKLFQRALRANTALQWIDLVNPDPVAATRYASSVPHMALRRYENVDQFLGGGSIPDSPAGTVRRKSSSD